MLVGSLYIVRGQVSTFYHEMNMKDMSKSVKSLEHHLHGLREDVIPRLEARLAGVCAYWGGSVSDLIGESFSYVANVALNGRVPLPRGAPDLYRLMQSKAVNLLKDEYKPRRRDHGRRSVHAVCSLDAVVDNDGRETLRQRADYDCWREDCHAEEEESRRQVVRKMLAKTFEKRRIIRENQRIFVAVKLQGQDRESVAVRYRTTRNNVDQIVARVVRALREEGLKIDWEMYDQAV